MLGGGGENDIARAASLEQASRIDLRPIDPGEQSSASSIPVARPATQGDPGKKRIAACRPCSASSCPTGNGLTKSGNCWSRRPLSHSGGIVFTPTLALGGTLYVELGSTSVGSASAAIERERITCMLMVPTMIGALLDHPRLKEFDLSSPETIFYGASPITPARLREAIGHFGPIFFQFYGQAEAPTAVTMMRREEHDLSSDQRLASCGRPVPEAAVEAARCRWQRGARTARRANCACRVRC